MAILIKKVFSKENGEYLYGYDLISDTYMGSRYIVTQGLNLEALSTNEALEELYAFTGNIFRCKDKLEFLKMFDTKPNGPLNY
tara:strand:- start:2340 stop:2588 length:249 start_codon:yes stop_codon:yes gene_type:complete